MHSSGIGKALMAQLSDARLDTILAEQGLAQFTPFTLTDPARLRDDLAATRARGYSIDSEERNEGMKCVAAPVFDALGDVVGGISVSGPSTRIRDDMIPDLGTEVARAAAELSRAIGADR